VQVATALRNKKFELKKHMMKKIKTFFLKEKQHGSYQTVKKEIK
jgi:hypothetical protein